MSREIKVKLGDGKSSLEKFKSLWKQVEKGKVPEKAIEEVHFTNAELLFQTMTSKRFELLRQIHHAGHISIRALSKEVSRDYKNVYNDIQALCHVGLVLKDKEGLLTVPYETITTEISMDIAA